MNTSAEVSNTYRKVLSMLVDHKYDHVYNNFQHKLVVFNRRNRGVNVSIPSANERSLLITIQDPILKGEKIQVCISSEDDLDMLLNYID